MPARKYLTAAEARAAKLDLNRQASRERYAKRCAMQTMQRFKPVPAMPSVLPPERGSVAFQLLYGWRH